MLIHCIVPEHKSVVTTTVCLSGEEHSFACLAFMALYHTVFNVGCSDSNKFGSRGVISSWNKHGASTRNGQLEQICNGIIAVIYIEAKMLLCKRGHHLSTNGVSMACWFRLKYGMAVQSTMHLAIRLTHWGLMTPYGVGDLDQHWLG